MMILTSTLSIFHSFPATYHLALLMVCIFHSSLDMHNAFHIMMISDIAISAWLIDFCHKTALRLEKSFKKFYGRYQDLTERYQRSVNVMVNDSFPG